jgi:hypothetical protein
MPILRRLHGTPGTPKKVSWRPLRGGAILVSRCRARLRRSSSTSSMRSLSSFTERGRRGLSPRPGVDLVESIEEVIADLLSAGLAELI